MIKQFGSTREVFVNQDEGMFVALPCTFDEDVLDLETETVGGRKLVKAGSLVVHIQNILGITAEPYDITNGPVTGRVVVEGYAWKDRLTTLAKAGLVKLPRIVTIPVEFDGASVDGIPAYYAMTLTGDGLSISAPDKDSIKDGTDVVITLTAPTGKELDAFTVGGVDKKANIVEGKYTHKVVADIEVAVTWKDKA